MNNCFQVNEKIQFSMDDQLTGLNNNFLVIGPPGCRKTSIVSYNNLKNKVDINQVIVDVKGRMKDLKDKYKQMGYRVLILDLIHPMDSMGYNPLLYIKDDQDIEFLANSLYGEITSKDPYWDIQGKNTLKLAIYYVFHACPLEKRNLRTVFGLIHSIQTDAEGLNLELLMEYYKEFHPEDRVVSDLYQSCNVQAKTTISCILNSLNAKISAYINDEIQHIFSMKKQINFDLLTKEKCVLFITMQDFDTTYHPIVNMILSQITKRLYQLADLQENGRLPYNVEFVLDDFGSYTINNFPALVSTGRSRGIWFTIMLQSTSQLKKRYDQEATTILECCDRILYMGGNGIDTINYLHDLCNCRKSVLSLLPLGKVMFWQRGKEGIVTEVMDISKEPEYCYWNYKHIIHKRREKKQKKDFEIIDEDVLKNIASRTTGLSIGILKNVVDLAYRSAFRENRKPTGKDLQKSLEEYNYGEKKEWGNEYYRSVAIHESGHTYLAYLAGEKPGYVTIESRGNFGGYMAHENGENKPILTKNEMIWKIRCALAGRVAEEVFYGKEASLNTGASSDLRSATNIALAMICNYGMLEDQYISLPFETIMNSSLATTYLTKANEIIKEEMNNTLRLVMEGKDKITALSELLLKENYLTTSQILSCLEKK